MADLYLGEVFGSQVTFDETNKVLSFSLYELDYMPDPTEITQANIDNYTSIILWAMLTQLINYQPTENNDDTRAIYVTNQGKRTAVRNGVSQFSFGLLVSGYTPDPLGTTIPPEALVTSQSNQQQTF